MSTLLLDGSSARAVLQKAEGNTDIYHPDAEEVVTLFHAERQAAKDALVLAQAYQRRAYNEGRLVQEFEEGDLVVLNVDSLELIRSEKGCGCKLLMKYDGPFEILRKISPVAYQVRLPASYRIHPVLNISHLEKYKLSPREYGTRPTKELNCADFNQLEEYEVEWVIRQFTRRGRNGKRVPIFLTQFVGWSL